MSVVKQNKKWIAWALIFGFLYLIQISSLPLGAETGSTESESPTAIEKASDSKPAIGKKSILPWILIGLGVVAVGVVVYFLIIKKPEYTLTVTLGDGVTGTPAAGSHVYKKGDTVNYSYTLAAGQKDITATLDGTSISASGTITMDKDHTLAVNSTEGLHEDFSTTASSGWIPRTASYWSVASDGYQCLIPTPPSYHFEYNVYNHSWSNANYTVTVRLKRKYHHLSYGILLATTSNMNLVNGYFFTIPNYSTFSIWKASGYNFAADSMPHPTQLQGGIHPAIHPGLDTWNTLKIVKAGSNYTLYANDTLVNSFSDPDHDPRYIVLTIYMASDLSETDYDYVYVDIGNTAGSIPGLPVESHKVQMDPNRIHWGQWLKN